MKKILFFLLLSNFLMAQHPDLINNNWRITKIVNELGEYVPPNAPVDNLTRFFTTNQGFFSNFYNSASGELSYIGTDRFTINSRACTLAQYMDDNGEVDQFFNKICAFFGPGATLFYTIQTNGNDKTLVIGNSIFEEIHFASVNLSTKENEIAKFILSPNPVQNILTVKSSVGINSVELFDLSGRKLYEIKNAGEKTLNVNMQNFKTGIYTILLNKEKSYKIIRK